MPSVRQLEHRIVLPRQQRYRRPLLFVHGAWHGAWCWETAMGDFADRGFVTHAVSLRGHGASDPAPIFNLCGIDDYLQDVRRAVAAITPTPVVVAHSMGGFLMQHYLSTEPLPGVVFLCSMPPAGPGPFVRRWARQHPLAVLKTILTANGRHLIGTARLAREAFFSPALSEELVAAHIRFLGPEAAAAGLDTLRRPPGPPVGSTPALVVAAAEDRVFSLEEQRAIAAVYHAPLVTIPAAAHDLMLDPAWPQAAAVIEEAVSVWAE